MDLLAIVLGEDNRDIGLLVLEVQGQDELEDAKGWRLQHECGAKKVVCFCLKALAD